MNDFLNSALFTYGVIPLLIFLARICDVSIGTLRIILVSKGNKYIPPFLGFFEVLIWITAVTRVMQNLDNIVCYFAYAGGFATGNYVGMLIEERMAMGVVNLRIITRADVRGLLNVLHKEHFGTTMVLGEGSEGKVQIIYTIVPRNKVHHIEELIKKHNEHIFYTVEDVKVHANGIFPIGKRGSFKTIDLFRRWRKGM